MTAIHTSHELDEAKAAQVITLAAMAELCRKRRAVRKFKLDPLPAGVLEQLLDCARWAPSGYNLQPTHFVVVDDARVKPALRRACMNQKQVEQAPVTVVFCGDRKVAVHHLDEVIEAEKQAGTINAEYEQMLRKLVPLSFGRGPLGLGWLWKFCLMPVARWFTPVPEFPAVHLHTWLCKQAMFPAMNFMLAAKAAGLDTVPMEGFDARAVGRVLNLPSHVEVCLVVPVGYAESAGLRKTRLPLTKMMHRNGW